MFTEDQKLPLSSRCPSYRTRSLNVISGNSFVLLVGRATIVPLVTRSHGNVRLDSDEPAGAADNSDVPCSRPAPSAQPVEAPAPRPRSGIAGLPARGRARGPTPSLPAPAVAPSSTQRRDTSVPVGTAKKPLWFGPTLTQYLVSEYIEKRRVWTGQDFSARGNSNDNGGQRQGRVRHTV